MKDIVSFAFLFALISGFGFLGCELETEPPIIPDLRPASTLVINELFTLPPSHPNTYTWIEFYNPTADTIDLTNWTLSFFTVRLQTDITATLDSLGNIRSLIFLVSPDTFGVFDVPISGGLFVDTVRLPPNGLYTIVNNEERLLDHTNWGPGDERFRQQRFFFAGPLTSIDTLFSSPDSIIVSSSFLGYAFFILPNEQVILKDPSGKIVDVVRIGDSVYTNVIGDSTYTDPLLGPSNRSIGPVPEFEAVARYAGAYFTGNTSYDFFVTRPGLRPIPHWHSQLYRYK